jgi:hypothetical protein
VTKAERVAGRIEEDPERLAGLMLRLGRSDRQRRLFAGIEIRDVEVEMQLLGMVTPRPVRRPVILDALEGDCRTAVGAFELSPTGVESEATFQPVRSL